MPKDKTLLRPVGDTAGGEAGERVNGAISQSRSEKQLLATTPNNTPRNHSLESIKARSTGQSADSRSHTVDRDLLSGHQKLTDTANSRASLLSSGRSAKELRKTVSRGFPIERSPPVRLLFTAEITDHYHLKGRKDPIPEQGSNRPKTAPSSSAKKEISKQYKPIKNAKVGTDPSLKPSTAHDGDATDQRNIDFLFSALNTDLSERLKKAQWLQNSDGEIGPLITELKKKLLECEETTERFNEIYDYIRGELPKEYIARLSERDEGINKNKDDIIGAIDALLNSSLYAINHALPDPLKIEIKDLNLTNLASAIKKFCTTCDLEAQKERTKIANELGFNSYDKSTNEDVNQDITQAQFLELLKKESRKKRSEFFREHLAPTLEMKTSSVWHLKGGMKEGIEDLKKKIEDLTEKEIELSQELEDSKESLLAREYLILSAEQDRKTFLNYIYTNIFEEVLEEGRDIEFQTLIEKLSEFKERLDSVPAGITEEYSTLKEQRETITRQTSEISLLQAQANSSIEANELTQKELTDFANRLGMNGYSDAQTEVNDKVTAQDISAEVTLIIERINSFQLENEKFKSLLMAREYFDADVKKTKEFSTQTDAPLDGFSMQPATPPDYSEILGSICAVVVDLKDTLKNLNLVAEERWSEAREVASEDLGRQGERESRRKEKDLLKKEEKEAEAERRREDEEKNTKRDQLLADFRKELAELKSKMEQDKKEAADAATAEKERTKKAAEDAKTAKEKEDKEKAVKDAKDEKAAKEKAAEDAKGPLQKFYDALEVQINKNPGRTILTPSGVSLKDLKEMGIDPKSLPGSIIPTAADKKSR